MQTFTTFVEVNGLQYVVTYTRIEMEQIRSSEKCGVCGRDAVYFSGINLILVMSEHYGDIVPKSSLLGSNIIEATAKKVNQLRCQRHIL